MAFACAPSAIANAAAARRSAWNVGSGSRPAAATAGSQKRRRQFAPPPQVEERKVVTALFCDLVGFTARSDQADPEDVRARMCRARTEEESGSAKIERPSVPTNGPAVSWPHAS